MHKSPEKNDTKEALMPIQRKSQAAGKDKGLSTQRVHSPSCLFFSGGSDAIISAMLYILRSISKNGKNVR